MLLALGIVALTVAVIAHLWYWRKRLYVHCDYEHEQVLDTEEKHLTESKALIEALRQRFPFLRVARRQGDADEMAAHLRDDHGAVKSNAVEIDPPGRACSRPAADGSERGAPS